MILDILPHFSVRTEKADHFTLKHPMYLESFSQVSSSELQNKQKMFSIGCVNST